MEYFLSNLYAAILNKEFYIRIEIYMLMYFGLVMF